jgi:hypothetical protein
MSILAINHDCVVMVYRRDLVRVRQWGDVTMIQTGGLWCEIAVDQAVLAHMQHQNIWYEIIARR